MPDWPAWLSDLAPRLPEAIFLTVVGVVIIPLLGAALNRMLKHLRLATALRGLIVWLVRTSLYILLLIGLLYSLGLVGLAATLSGGVLAIGLVLSQSLKELLTDMVAGFNLARDPDFDIGYTIEVGGKTTGVVEEVGARKVRLLDKEGYTHVLPNGMVEKSEWVVRDRQSKIKDIKRKT